MFEQTRVPQTSCIPTYKIHGKARRCSSTSPGNSDWYWVESNEELETGRAMEWSVDAEGSDRAMGLDQQRLRTFRRDSKSTWCLNI
uniref:Uncharacterized protein n=1 Tax=Cannabis sativa TaxID=3483 RepID=A0A803PUK1_CANSA